MILFKDITWRGIVNEVRTAFHTNYNIYTALPNGIFTVKVDPLLTFEETSMLPPCR
jgi:hypothetical protein